MAQVTEIVIEPWDVRRRLAELGLTEDILLEAAKRAFVAGASCTPNHPRSFVGLAAWGEAINALGELLAPVKWVRIEDRGLPLVVNHAGTIAITFATANEATGREGPEPPRSRSAKGPITRLAVAVNLCLFPEMELEALRRVNHAGRQTWHLLLYRNNAVGEYRCEFSRPSTIDEKGHIIDWSERIILSRAEFDQQPRVKSYEPDDDSGARSPEIKVEIKRRA